MTVLYELCCRKLEGIQPDYKWIHHEGQVHKPTFYVRLEVSDVVVVTHASSKKKAKQVAALAALRTLGQFAFHDICSCIDTFTVPHSIKTE